MRLEFMGPAPPDMGSGTATVEGCPIQDMDAEEFWNLCRSIIVFVPHRREEGPSSSIAAAAGYWARWGVSYSYVPDTSGGNLDLLRAGICRSFLDISAAKPVYRFMVMIDNDEEIEALDPIKLCRWGEPFVTGVVCSLSEFGSIKACFTKKDRYGNNRFPTVAFTRKMPTRGLVPIESAGAGLIAVRRDALQAVVDSGARPFLIPEDVRMRFWDTGVLGIGEDISFCRQLAAVGMARYADLSVRAIHLKQVKIAWPEEHLDEDMDPQEWQVDPRDLIHV